jgi:hypothetical protein
MLCDMMGYGMVQGGVVKAIGATHKVDSLGLFLPAAVALNPT